MRGVLSRKAALVTGAGRDLGRFIAASLAAEGADVAIHYNSSKDGALALCAGIRRQGGAAFTLKADLRSTRAAESLVRRAARLLGRLDILVNSAGVFLRSDPVSLTSRTYDRLMALNVRAPIFCARAAAELMQSRGGGRIINITSLGAFESWPAYMGYCASKAALVSVTRSMALAFAPTVSVNSVAPGLIDLPADLRASARRRLIQAIPARRTGSYEDVAKAVLYLCTADYVTGQTLVVDGGASLRRSS